MVGGLLLFPGPVLGPGAARGVDVPDVEDPLGARRARDGGADRIEICRDLSCGGLTPAFDEVAAALEAAPSGGVQVLVRPRPGDFAHSREEVDRIASDIARLSSLGRGAPAPWDSSSASWIRGAGSTSMRRSACATRRGERP